MRVMNKLSHWISGIPPWVRNRYTLTFLFFLVWMIFFDNNNLISRVKTIREIRQAEAKKAYYEKEIQAVRHDMEALFSDDQSLEKFAREKYHMKRENEDLFLIKKD